MNSRQGTSSAQPHTPTAVDVNKSRGTLFQLKAVLSTALLLHAGEFKLTCLILGLFGFGLVIVGGIAMFMR